MALKKFSQLTGDQLGSIDFLLDHPSGGLWADVGTGKTVSALTAVKRLIDRFDVRRVLVIGPRLVAERVWSSEVEEWEHLNGIRVSRIVGGPAQRLRAMDNDADIYTITRDNVVWLEEQFIKDKKQYRRWPWDLVILDECQSFKSQSSKRFKSLRRLRRLFSRCWLLTGSLMPNGYRDLWAQLYLVDGGKRLGLTETKYHDTYFKKEVTDGIPSYEILPGSAEKIDALVGEVFHVMRDVQPPAPRNFIRVQLSKSELALYRKMVRTSVIEGVADQPISAVNAGVLWGKLLQMANGAVYDSDHKWHEIHKQKLEALWELLESLPRPVIVGYGFVHDVERILNAYNHGGATRRLGRMEILRTGSSLDRWRKGEIDIGIMHPASAGHGLNDLYVSGAENLIWFGFTNNREFYDQLNGRLAGGHRRTGRSVCIHHIVAESTIDEEAVALLDFKGDQQTSAQVRVAQRLQGELCAASPETTNDIRIPGSRFPTAQKLTSIE